MTEELSSCLTECASQLDALRSAQTTEALRQQSKKIRITFRHARLALATLKSKGFPVVAEEEALSELNTAFAKTVHQVEKTIHISERTDLIGKETSSDDPVHETLASTERLLHEIIGEQDEALGTLVSSTETLKEAVLEHQKISGAATEGKEAMRQIRWADVKERLLVFLCFFVFVFSALLILHIRLTKPGADRIGDALGWVGRLLLRLNGNGK